MSGNKNTTIAFNYFGGKFTWLKYLYANFPPHFTHLVDLFAGSMCVSLNYKGRCIKTANEINTDITNFFEVLRDHEQELIFKLNLTPISEAEYDNCWNPSICKIENARRFYVVARQAFRSIGAQRENKGWNMTKSEVNAQRGAVVSAWNNAIPKLHDVAEVIRANFQIMNRSYDECIKAIDSPTAFFYCDPPYPLQCRKSSNDYKYEFTDEDHRALAEKLHNIEGMAMVSGYDCPLMEELYGDWTKIAFPTKNNNIRSGKVQEVIWINYQIAKTLFN